MAAKKESQRYKDKNNEYVYFKDEEARRRLDEILGKIYPVGSIYTSVNSTSPETLFGGKWQQISGRFLLSADSTHSVGSTGGTADAVVPYHTHTFTGNSVTTGNQSANHTHSIGAHNHGLNNHTHSVGAHNHGLNNHTHSVGAHAHGLNSHAHSIPSLSGSTTSNGSHNHGTGDSKHQAFLLSDNSAAVKFEPVSNGTYITNGIGFKTDTAGAHTHSVTINSSTTGNAGGSTANSAAFNTGQASGTTANSTSFNTGAASGNTANSAAYTSGSNSANHTHTVTATGANDYAGTSGNTKNANMPPYLTVYMWQRIA